MNKNEKLWGGRFSEGADEKFYNFNRSFDFDKLLFRADIQGSIAHCNALEKAGVLSPTEAKQIVQTLKELDAESTQTPDFYADTDAEDVHSFIESKLTAKLGELGKKIHAGRSRNDQVATAMRIWTGGAIGEVIMAVRRLQSTLVSLAEDNFEAVMPGYTHLQRAQPVLFAHWCLAYFEMFRRDLERFSEVFDQVNVLPLGSAALAGSSYPIDREAVAAELQFKSISRNSLDAVSDRDFCLDFIYASSMVMLHLSRFAEDVILYCSQEFAFLSLSDKVSTGSSIMPQKKNPDSMELVRGKAGRVFGDLAGLFTTMKGLPLAYNKDMQEDKEAVFDAYKTVVESVEVTAIVAENLSVNHANTAEAAEKGYLNATELADYLTGKDIPFRRAHEIVGQLVLFAISERSELGALTLEQMRKFAPEIEDDVFARLSIEKTIDAKNVIGGTARKRVREALDEAKAFLHRNEKQIL